MKNNLSIPQRELEELKKVNGLTNENIKKLKNNYPIQYLIGYTNFYGLNILVNENVLIPRYETEYLVEKLIKYIKKYNFNNPKILDLCTGSGCIGLTLKNELKHSNIIMSDISEKALEVANRNKENLKLDVTLIESDLFDNIKDKDFDIIVSNPPYVMTTENLPKNVLYEPHQALFSGEKGIDHIELIIKNYEKYTKNKSILALEINEQSENEITNLINKYITSNIKYSFEKDLTGRIRYLFIFRNMET